MTYIEKEYIKKVKKKKKMKLPCQEVSYFVFFQMQMVTWQGRDQSNMEVIYYYNMSSR